MQRRGSSAGDGDAPGGGGDPLEATLTCVLGCAGWAGLGMRGRGGGDTERGRMGLGVLVVGIWGQGVDCKIV
jgi:hypothetical protein